MPKNADQPKTTERGSFAIWQNGMTDDALAEAIRVGCACR
jgi:hypothetical protein